MYNRQEILGIAKEQMARDYNCKVEDFEQKCNTLTENKLIDGRRINDGEGSFLKILSFAGKLVISADKEILPLFEERLDNFSGDWIFHYGTLKLLDARVQEFGHEIVDIHHYYLPNPKGEKAEPKFDIIWYEQGEMEEFRGDNRFGEALLFDESVPDMLAVCAMDGENIMGMAGATRDSETMWQIGINVMPEYSGRGVATNLVSLLKDEILNRGKVPFYGTVSSHMLSQNVALKAGFLPVFSELYTNKIE